MKTHELARSLSGLAKFLRSMPNTELESFLDALKARTANGGQTRENEALAVNVATLAALSRISKSHWKDLIDQWRLPISVPRKDSARNIMGEVMRYLTTHPAEIHRLQTEVRASRASPPLMKALSILMSDSNEEPQPRD